MQLTYLHIHNFKSIRDMEIRDIDRALILVGKNNTGKTSILDAVCAVCGCYQVQEADFNEREQAIRIGRLLFHQQRGSGPVPPYGHRQPVPAV